MISTGPDAYGVGGSGYKPFGFKYGYFEARMKIPAGQGLWSGAWTFLRATTDRRSSISPRSWVKLPATTRRQSTIPAASPHSPSQVRTSLPVFTYSVWIGNLIMSLGILMAVVRTYSVTANIPNTPMYLMLMLATGGNWPGAPNVSTPFPANVDVDWVRVWQH